MNPANFNYNIAWTDFTEKTVSPTAGRSAFTKAKWPFTFDFDKNLDLVARFTANSLRPDAPILATVLRTARFELPIRGQVRRVRRMHRA